MELVLGITGASGVCYGIDLLDHFSHDQTVNLHLILSDNAKQLIAFETTEAIATVQQKAQHCYDNSDLTPSIASGSKRIDAMAIVPCSMSTAAKINTGIADNLITRVADVCLKEGRKLIIVPRETPLNSTHLKNLSELSSKSVIVLPAMPAFYHQPQGMNDLVSFITGKILDALGLDHNLYQRWEGDK